MTKTVKTVISAHSAPSSSSLNNLLIRRASGPDLWAAGVTTDYVTARWEDTCLRRGTTRAKGGTPVCAEVSPG